MRVRIIPRFWTLALALLIVLRAPALAIDVLDPDEAGHAVNAATWLEGGVPYVDFADNKQPFVYGAYALAFAFCGRSLAAVHALTLPWLLATGWLVGGLAAATWGTTVARRWGVLLFVLGGSAYLEKDMLATNTEVLMNLPLAAAFWVVFAPSRLPAGAVAALSGLAAGAALLFNLKAALALPGLLLALASFGGAARWARAAIWTASAGVLPAVVVAYLWHRGGLTDAWFWNVALNFSYSGAGLPLGSLGVAGGTLYGFPRLLLFGLATLPLWIGAGVAARRAWPDCERRASAAAAFVWLAGSLAGACIGGRFYGHYFVALLPPLAWLASGPLASALARPAGSQRAPRAWLRAAAVLGLVVPVAGLTIAGWVRISNRHLDALRPEVFEVADAVRQRTSPADRVFVWGYWPQLYYYAGRPPATRFVFPQTLAGYVPGRPDILASRPRDEQYMRGDHWELWAADMARHPAELLIDTAPAAIHYWEHFPMSAYPPLADLVARRYRHEATVAGVSIYRLRRDVGDSR
ncbi:MAG: hypothetical protein KBA95_11025 [Acidobacteria bacterium]|nr:hypothetical protein [Acidobacteriota bacterium]